MATVTAPIMTDATGQSIDSKLNSLLGKMDNLAAAFQPNASGIVYNNTTSGLTGDDVQEAIDEMAADVSEIKSSLSELTTGELGQMTKVGTKFNFGSQNVTLRIGRMMQCTLVITVTSAITDGETFIKLPKAMRIPCVFLLANDAGTLYKVGNTDSNSDEVKALYGSGLPAGNYRGSFMYLTVE